MQKPRDLEAIRWWCAYAINSGEEPDSMRIYDKYCPEEYWSVAVLRKSEEVRSVVTDVVDRVISTMDRHFNPPENLAGYAFDPSVPYNIEPELFELVHTVVGTEKTLEEYNDELQQLSEKIDFTSESFYQDAARIRLKLMWKLLPRIRLFIHSHLWLLWISQSLNQANEFRRLIVEHGYFEDLGAEAYSLLAFPPILTAAISCTAVLEEVGCKYVNSHRDSGTESIDPENTSCRRVLRALEDVHIDSSEYDFERILQEVVEPRDVYSHYMIQRQSEIDLESIDGFMKGVSEAFFLIRDLAIELVVRPIARYESHEWFSWD